MGVGGEGCRRTKTKTWIGKHATGTAKTEIHTVLVERGMSWSEVQEKWAELSGDLEGFYLSHQVCLATRLLLPAMSLFFRDYDLNEGILEKIDFSDVHTGTI